MPRKSLIYAVDRHGGYGQHVKGGETLDLVVSLGRPSQGTRLVKYLTGPYKGKEDELHEGMLEPISEATIRKALVAAKVRWRKD